MEACRIVKHRKDHKSELLEACSKIIGALGEDPEREGLLKTPQRMAESLAYFTSGYTLSLQVETDDLVLIKDIDIFSMCEHHLVPFFGKLHVAYIPRGKVLGLSKIPRVAEFFCRRLQVQERLTKEISCAIQEVLDPSGVAVMMECTHMCMVMRGVEKVGSNTITTSMHGLFKHDSTLRNDFMNLIKS